MIEATNKRRTPSLEKADGMYSVNLSQAGHTRRYRIREVVPAGWEVLKEEDSRVVKQVLYDDWHRVERARISFEIEASTLEQAGWVVEPS